MQHVRLALGCKAAGRAYSNNPNWSIGQYTSTAFPLMLDTGTEPKYLESCELVLLSPITQTSPAGTV